MRLASIAVLASLLMVFGDISLPAQQSDIEARIRAAAARLVIDQPDYTCLQTIKRFERRRKKGKFRKIDSVRVEVALINGQEVFSWPGARQFDIENIGEIIPTGAASTGSFALHAKSIFSLGLADWTPAGEEQRNGVACLKYAYRIPQHKSQYWLRTRAGASIVGQHGFFWVDASTYDLVRIEVFVDDIQAVDEEIAEIAESVDYSRSKIGAGESVLPGVATSTVSTHGGFAMRNTMTFTDCRQYVGESTISFGPVEVPPEAAATPAPLAGEQFEIPAGLFVELVLETPLRVGDSAVGDRLSAYVRGNVKHRGEVVLPSGARATGRITMIDRQPHRSDRYTVAITFNTVEFEEKRAPLRLTLLEFRSRLPLEAIASTTPMVMTAAPRGSQPPSPEGVFYVHAPRTAFLLPKGTVILYKTR